MEYGPRWKHVYRAALISLFGGVLCGVLLLVAGCPYPIVIYLCLLICPLYPGLMALFCCWRIHIRNGYVEHVFLGRWVIQRRKLARFVEVEDEQEGEIVFEQGKTLRMMGMPRDERQRLSAELISAALVAGEAERTGCDRLPCQITIHPHWLTWQDGTVRKLVVALEQENSFEQLGILADALEDADCRDETILSHLRQPGTHAGCCWAVELLRKG